MTVEETVAEVNNKRRVARMSQSERISLLAIALANRRRLRTRRPKCRIQPLAQHSLQPQTCTNERQPNKCQCVRPRRVLSLIRNTRLPALPKRNRTRHRKQRLNERPAEEPYPLLRTDLVSDASHNSSEVERDERAKRLPICDPKGLNPAFP